MPSSSIAGDASCLHCPPWDHAHVDYGDYFLCPECDRTWLMGNGHKPVPWPASLRVPGTWECSPATGGL